MNMVKLDNSIWQVKKLHISLVSRIWGSTSETRYCLLLFVQLSTWCCQTPISHIFVCKTDGVTFSGCSTSLASSLDGCYIVSQDESPLFQVKTNSPPNNYLPNNHLPPPPKDLMLYLPSTPMLGIGRLMLHDFTRIIVGEGASPSSSSKK